MRIAGAPLRPMELRECPHEGRLRLVDFGTGEAQHLLHSATGENVALHGRWRLDFVEQMGFLTPLREPSGRAAVWCNELLAFSLHEDPSDDGHLFMLRKGSTEPHLASAFEGRVVVIGFSHRASVGEFTCEVYKHTYPPKELGCLRYWAMPFIQDFVWGSDLHNKFTCRHFPGWECHLRKLGFSNIAEHMRRSAKSELCVAKKRRVASVSTVAFGSEQEFSISTVALLVLVAWVAAERRAQSVAKRQESDRAALLLRIVLDSFLGGRAHVSFAASHRWQH